MNTYQSKTLPVVSLVAMLAAMVACGGHYPDDGSGDLPDSDEIGQAEQAITTDWTLSALWGKSHALGSIPNGVPGPQAQVQPGAPNNTYYLPWALNSSVRFSGFGADQPNVKTQAGNAEANMTFRGYSYAHLADGAANTQIAVVNIADDGGPLSSTLNSYFSVSCTANGATTLSEPTSVPGIYRKLSGTAVANGVCTIGIKLAKIKRLYPGTTTRNRVLRNGMSWGFGAIGGLGECVSCTGTTDFMTREVRPDTVKQTLQTGQSCLLEEWISSPSTQYVLEPVLGSHCTELQLGY